ncbi:DUF1045 domain-containing protein [Cohaesibacter intestini]|uniref:DUF1045 domain-containing protein n=1 Tax=Cohaesibacter intestini TaxID=2211145 RepID=UPI000DEB5443|nr:DUF1045 domain-containing protein [Cohaesibacter intestini]
MPRYALFFAPPKDDPLTEAAAIWLGRDAFGGGDIDRPSLMDGQSREAFDAMTASPRRYGFHGTLKAPFELAPGTSIDQLVQALDTYAAGLKSFTLPMFEVGRLGPFFALRTERPSDDLKALASSLVRDFDPFRAPLDAHDIARRKPERLSDSQRDNLMTWGYPYIFDDFRFHMTLSDPISEELADRFEQAAKCHFEAVLTAPQSVSALSLFVEAERGAPFKVLHQFPFGSGSA